MNNIFQYIQKCFVMLVGLLIVLTPMLSMPRQVHATDKNWDVIFEQLPLFSEANFLPGDSVTRWIKVINDTGEAQPVILRTHNHFDPFKLGKRFHVLITNADTDEVYYDDTLQKIFHGFMVVFPDLPDGEMITYNMQVTFDPEAGNEYQELQLGFDLMVGFYGGDLESDNPNDQNNNSTSGNGTTTEETEENNPPQIIQSFSGGGGGGNGPISFLEELVISNVRVVSVNELTGSVVIAWDTNIPATSQIVYGKDFDGPFSLNLTNPNFGYSNSNTEDTVKTEIHQMTLTGLDPFELYRFRVVSRTTQPSVSFEQTFFLGPAVGGDFPVLPPNGTIPPEGTDTSPLTNTSSFTPISAGPTDDSSGTTTPSTGENSTSTEESIALETTTSDDTLPQPDRSLLAGLIFSLPEGIRDFLACSAGALILLLAIYLIWFLVVDRKHEAYQNRWEFFKYQMRFLITSAVVGLFVLMLLDMWCSLLPFLIFIALVIVYLMWMYRRGTK